MSGRKVPVRHTPEGQPNNLDAMDTAPVFRDKPVSFVRRSGRMSEAQDRAWAELSPFYLLPVERAAATTSVRAGTAIDPAEVYGRTARLVVEIGSGQGHQIVSAASADPDSDFLAVEVFTAGLARTMLDADRAGVKNLRLVEANAPEALEHLLPAASVDDVWIFFPDPWHKNKHTKRRLVAPDFARIAAQALRPGGTLRLATDGRTMPTRCAPCSTRRPASSGRSRGSGPTASRAACSPPSNARGCESAAPSAT